jgi:hypothetical protein
MVNDQTPYQTAKPLNKGKKKKNKKKNKKTSSIQE